MPGRDGGTATTCKMALLNDRYYLGFEPWDEAFEIARRRMDDAHREYRPGVGSIPHGHEPRAAAHARNDVSSWGGSSSELRTVASQIRFCSGKPQIQPRIWGFSLRSSRMAIRCLELWRDCGCPTPIRASKSWKKSGRSLRARLL